MVGAVNIPIGNLRLRVGELNKDSKVLVYCWVGYRGYLASRLLLEQKGFEVFNLDGGFKNVLEGGYRSPYVVRVPRHPLRNGGNSFAPLDRYRAVRASGVQKS
ncbi:hypothetical protein EV126DRAFT_177097 [Verticillium dahliae]|nr:hypothetical protein EV126DRAFT_177097 [Verticillium dahliae]